MVESKLVRLILPFRSKVDHRHPSWLSSERPNQLKRESPMTEPLLFGDCHTHLDQYDEAELPSILERAAEVGVASVILAGTTLESTRACIGLAGEFDAFYAGVGIHPCQAYGRVEDETYAELERLAQSPKVVCISEVGLDYLPESPDHSVQDQVFRAAHPAGEQPWTADHLPLAGGSLGLLPGTAGGVRRATWAARMHYFQADEATAREAIDCGFYISLARPLTRLAEVQEAARAIPLENIVLETDALPAALQEGTATTGRSRGTWPRWRSAWQRSRAYRWRRWRRVTTANLQEDAEPEADFHMTTEHAASRDAPEQIVPQSLNDYLEVMTKAVFQSGLSWSGSDQQVAGVPGRVSRDSTLAAVCRHGRAGDRRAGRRHRHCPQPTQDRRLRCTTRSD